MTNLNPSTFNANQCSTFWVILLTDRQTDRQGWSHHLVLEVSSHWTWDAGRDGRRDKRTWTGTYKQTNRQTGTRTGRSKRVFVCDLGCTSKSVMFSNNWNILLFIQVKPPPPWTNIHDKYYVWLLPPTEIVWLVGSLGWCYHPLCTQCCRHAQPSQYMPKNSQNNTICFAVKSKKSMISRKSSFAKGSVNGWMCGKRHLSVV